MTAQDILDRLLACFPDFAELWDSKENYFKDDDGSFTRCGVFAKFSHYFRDRYEQLSSAQLAGVGKLMTDCVDSTDRDLWDAAATCFLENVAGERFSPDFKRHLAGEAFRFYSLWDKPA